jgi:hypothetical protein
MATVARTQDTLNKRAETDTLAALTFRTLMLIWPENQSSTGKGKRLLNYLQH